VLTLAVVSGVLFTFGFLMYREDYRGIARIQRALFLAASEQRVLEPGELVPERRKLDADASRLPGFTRLGDFVEIYPENPGFSEFSKNPFRALVDDEGTTVAVIFRLAELVQVKTKTSIAYRDDTTRVSLSTAFSDGRWIVTQKTFGLGNKKPVFPAQIDIQDFDWEIPLNELLTKHAARVDAAIDHQEEGYRGAARSDAVIVRTLEVSRRSSQTSGAHSREAKRAMTRS
jgi:hypothetical protein